VGAYAVTLYSRPRFTRDLDVWVDPDPANAHRAWKALAAYGAPVADLRAEHLSAPGMVFQIGVTTTRIDILTSIADLEFEDCWPRRTAGEYMDQRVHFLSLEDLIRNKRAVGRPQDLIDLRALEKVRRRGARRPRRRPPPSSRRRP
jgi:hypothetical protein